MRHFVKGRVYTGQQEWGMLRDSEKKYVLLGRNNVLGFSAYEKDREFIGAAYAVAACMGRRHQRVSRTWVITHFSVSTALILITWFSVGMFNKRSKGLVDYSEAFNHRLPAWELAIGMAVLSFLVLQLTVFAYLIIRLIRPAKTQ